MMSHPEYFQFYTKCWRAECRRQRRERLRSLATDALWFIAGGTVPVILWLTAWSVS